MYIDHPVVTRSSPWTFAQPWSRATFRGGRKRGEWGEEEMEEGEENNKNN